MMKKMMLICAATLMSSVLCASVPGGGDCRFAIGESEFIVDGKPFLIRCGEIHFARVPRPYWRHRLQMCRAMGLNAVCAYVFWNYHEQQPGIYDFTGERDVAAFCRMAQEEGLWVILRPGPYVCAEWDFGGLPWWLLKDGEDGVRVRTIDPRFLVPAKRFLARLGQELAPLQVTRGGPILMVQVENEYGSFGKDANYMGELAKAMREAGFEVQLFACNGPGLTGNGRIDGVFDVVNFGSNPAGSFAALRKFRKTGPLMNGEYYPAWFDTWGEGHHLKQAEKVCEEIGWMLEHRASFSIYMAHGGTTFGWWAGGNTPYKPQTSSYDYDAPISESGEATAKFHRLRALFERHFNAGEVLPAVPDPIPHTGFVVPATAAAAKLEGAPRRELDAPTSFECLGLGYGVAVFSREIPSGGEASLSCAGVRDHAAVFCDERLVGFLDRRHPSAKITLPQSAKARQLKIVVTAMGRFNFGHEGLEHASKGIAADVLLDGHALRGRWLVETYSYDAIGKGAGLTFGKKTPFAEQRPAPSSVLRIGFRAKAGADTWLDVAGWPFGLVWINGHPLGRYWAIGPTRTMFVPGCWLKDGDNELVVWDLKGVPGSPNLTFLDHPILDELHPDRDLAVFSGKGELRGPDSAAEQQQSNGTLEGSTLRNVISEKYKVLVADDWGGGKRTIFDFNGRRAWLVEPAQTAKGRPWVWTMQWMGFFTERTGAVDLVKNGYCHVHLEAFDTRADDEGLKTLAAFQDYLVGELGLAPKADLIGMSWGGFYSVRYANAYPDKVARIYLDAPLLGFRNFMCSAEAETAAERIGPWSKAEPADGNWLDDPRMPVNMAASIARAKIPVLLLYGGQDQTVDPSVNCELFASRFKAAGGDIAVECRSNYGHHPHGLDVADVQKIVNFFTEKRTDRENAK